MREHPVREGSSGTTAPSEAELVALAYDAVGEVRGWSRFLRALALAYDGRSLTFVLRDAGDTFYATTSAPREGLSTMNPAAVFSERSLSPRSFLLGHVIRSGTGSGPFGELLEEREELRRLFGSEGATSALELFGGARRALPQSELALARGVLPHLHRALRLDLKVSRRDVLAEGLAAVVDSLKLGILLLTPDAGIRYVNAAARTLLAQHSSLATTDGRLTATSNVELSRAIRCAASLPASGRLEHPKVSSHGEGETSILLWLLPMRPGLALGVLTAPKRDGGGGCPHHLQEAFGITRKEAEVVCLFAQSKTPEEIARLLGVSPATVRLHLKHAMAKTETHRQVELLRRVVDLVPEVVL